MSANAPTKLHPIPTYTIVICQYISEQIGFWKTNLVSLIINILTTSLTTVHDATFEKEPIADILRHWPLYVGILVGTELLFGLVTAIGKLPVLTKSPQKLRKEYLASLIGKIKKLNIEGMPIPHEIVMLDEIFIPLHLKPHKSTIDDPLTEKYRRLLRDDIEKGYLTKETEAILIQAEQHFGKLVNKSDSVTIQVLWEGLTCEEPAAVIQGAPGMGKSTLLLRLALHMARHSNREKDDIAGQTIAPAFIPIFISLRHYARYRQKTDEDKPKSLKAYLASLPDEMTELSSPDTVNWLLSELSQGRCLVLFDALDEVNDPSERSEVQKAIQNFVIEAGSQTKGNHTYTRFLITSRIAGYEKYTFPYPHYTLAELTREQIQEFLPRWCRASAQRNLQNISTEEQRISREAARIERDLLDALEKYQGFALMAENPFLLTLLVIMRQNNLALPHRRIELYETITQIFLSSRNTERQIPEIPELQALQYLGPVAYRLQASKSDFMTQGDVLALITQILIDAKHASADQAPQEAKTFLKRVRERGGIFVFRTGDFLGFFHRTFREYFAARHLLDRLANDSTSDHKEQKNLLAKVRDTSDLWREPFLLAIAYNGKSPDAQRLLKLLLARHKGDSQKQYAHDVLLVGRCLTEAKPYTMSFELEQQIIQTLLEVYQDALVTKDIQICKNVEEEFINLLRGVPKENEHSVLLQTFQQTLKNTSNQTSLHALLTLLLIIAPQLRRCTDVVFAKLVPPLLGLTGLPAIGDFKPMSPNAPPDFTTIDGALNVLRSLGASGPAGTALKEERANFEPHLEQLAKCSLERGLITPTLIPYEQENFERYGQAMRRWVKLKEKPRSSPNQDLQEAIDIQYTLLQAAEEPHYPLSKHFLEMLARSQGQTDWPTIWQGYLSEQMEKGEYLDYQLCALLWATLFPDRANQQALATRLNAHFQAIGLPSRFARRFILKLVRDLRDLRDLNDLNDLRYLRDLRDLRDLSILNDLSDLRYLRYLRYLSYLNYLNYLRDLRDLRDLIYLRGLRDLIYLSDLVYLSNFSNLSKHMFTNQIVQKIEILLENCSDVQEHTELLLLLQGRALQIQEGQETGVEVEREVARLVGVAIMAGMIQNATMQIVFDIIRSLPARTEAEITFILQLAQGQQYEDISRACAEALRRSRPQDDNAWTALEIVQTSSIDAIQKAAKQRLEYRQRTKK